MHDKGSHVIPLLSLYLKPKNRMKHKKYKQRSSIKVDSKKTADRGSNKIEILNDKNSSCRVPVQAEFRK